MKKIKLPSPPLLIMAGLASFWIAGIINPGFNPIGVMLFLLVPVLIIEILYPQPDLESIVENASKMPILELPVSAELVEDNSSSEK